MVYLRALGLCLYFIGPSGFFFCMAALSWSDAEYGIVERRKLSQIMSSDVSERQQIYTKQKVGVAWGRLPPPPHRAIQ